MKKAQVEIIGLLIIVLIISIIMLFALKSILDPRTDPTKLWTDKDMGSSMVGAILNTHSGCTEDTLFSELLVNCARFPPTGSRDLVCDDGQGSCDYSSQKIRQLFADTLDVWKKDYEFQVLTPSNQVIKKLNFNSTGLKRGADVSSFVQPLPVGTNGGPPMHVVLCIGGPCS